MTTSTSSAAGRSAGDTGSLRSRCASNARTIAWQVIAGFLAFIAGDAVMAYGTGITVRLLAIATALAAYGAVLSLPGWVRDLRTTEDEDGS